MNTTQEILEDEEALKKCGLYYRHRPLDGYTEKVEDLLAKGDRDMAERFTYAFFVRRKLDSDQAEPYIPAVLARTGKCPGLLARIDAYFRTEHPIE